MKIHCGGCHAQLEDDDIIIMDQVNGLTHRCCYFYHDDFIKTIDMFKNIKEKYWFFVEDEWVH